jgi:hypothetical protein
MTNLLVLLNIVSLISSNQSIQFSELLNRAETSDISFAEVNNISDWNDYEVYLRDQVELNNNSSEKSKGDGNDGSISDSILEVEDYLNENYSDYYWIRDDENCALTSDVSNHIPIEMQSSYFPSSDIDKAIVVAGVEDETSYGGCGPIASLGIMDYFARYLGYDEIISDPTNSDKRVILASEVFSHTYFSIFGGKDNTLVWPWDYSSCFNTVMSNHGLSNVISASDQWTLFGGQQTNYWNQIVENIDEGMPVTLFTGMACGDGDFSQHYTNIYGYETWIGIPDDGGERLTKTFIKARINWGRGSEYYCDADILNCGQLGIITYDINYSQTYSFYDYDFAEEFVNDSGGGQYFFYTISEPVLLGNGKTLQTTRLRTSYIENQYLVLSPNRENAGTAYLDITFPNSVSKLSFTASMWSGLEGAINEDFKVQYYDGGWKNHINIDPYDLSNLKEYPDSFTVLFPKDTNRIRFYATQSNPGGDRNKGRICLNNFVVDYN